METAKFHNPYAGVAYAWQLTETLPEFLSRLPPATTDQSEDVPWIFICNPFVAREDKTTVVDAHMKGNEDEAPPEAGRQLSFVVEGAKERLTLLSELMQRVKTSGKAGAFIARELSQERRHAASDILHLAHAGRVRTGKASSMTTAFFWNTANIPSSDASSCFYPCILKYTIISTNWRPLLLHVVDALLLSSHGERAMGAGCQSHSKQRTWYCSQGCASIDNG